MLGGRRDLELGGRAFPSMASPSRRGGGVSRKPAPWHTVKKQNIKADGLVQTRIKHFIRQFPELEVMGEGVKNQNWWQIQRGGWWEVLRVCAE